MPMNRKLIGLFGYSGSGKSTFCEYLAAERSDITVLSQDSFYRKNLSSSSNFDSPDALDLEFIQQVLASVNSGVNKISQPQYDFVTHSRSGYIEIPLKPIVLFEGHMFPLMAGLNEFFNYLLFYDTPLDIAIMRRIKRDFVQRGRSLESICDQYTETVRDTALRIQGISKYATHVVNDDFAKSYSRLVEQGLFDY